MLFPTVLFAIFFVVAFLLHWGTERYPLARKWILLAASLFFYGVWSWKFALMLLASAVLNHGAAVLLASWTQASHRRRLMIITVGLNLLSLCFLNTPVFSR